MKWSRIVGILSLFPLNKDFHRTAYFIIESVRFLIKSNDERERFFIFKIIKYKEKYSKYVILLLL